MGNLIRAEFYRLRCRPHSVLGMALILLLSVAVMTASCALPPQAGNAATLLHSISTLSVSGMFFAVWCAAAASSGVNKLDILKHEAVFGVPAGRSISPAWPQPACWVWLWWFYCPCGPSCSL